MTAIDIFKQVLQERGYSPKQADTVMQFILSLHPSDAIAGREEIPPSQEKEKLEFARWAMRFWDDNPELAVVLENAELDRDQKNN